MAFQLPNYPGDNEGLFVFSKANKGLDDKATFVTKLCGFKDGLVKDTINTFNSITKDKYIVTDKLMYSITYMFVNL